MSANTKPAMIRGSTCFFVILVVYVGVALLQRWHGTPLLINLGKRQADTTLGEPRKGVHTLRLGGMAFLDLAMTTVIAIAYTWLSQGSFIPWLVAFLVTGEVVHAVYGVPTTTYIWLFGQPV